MSAIFSWIKKEIEYLIKSLPDIIRGFVFFILAFSGLICALLLRHLGFNGTIIASVSISVELFSLILCYFIFKGYFEPAEELKAPSKTLKKR
jgi:hypothetical protein